MLLCKIYEKPRFANSERQLASAHIIDDEDRKSIRRTINFFNISQLWPSTVRKESATTRN